MDVLCTWRKGVPLFVLFFIAFLYVQPVTVFAADLSLSPASSAVTVGDKFSIKVMLDPGSDSVNAAEGTMGFDKDLLSVDSITKDGSVFSLWTADPSFDNAGGTLEFSGGTPTAFSATGKILTIVFKAKAVGDAKVTFTKGSVLAADGKGTDVYKNGTGGTFTIAVAAPKPVAAPDPPPAPAPAADAGSSDSASGDGATPIAPIISSPQFTKPDVWFGSTTVVFNWVLTSDVTSVRTLLSDKDNQTPKTALKGATTTQTVIGVKDGVSYFYVQGKNDFGWGEVGKLKIQVDTVPPATFEITLLDPGTSGGSPKLSFKTDDLLSGMDRYDLIIGTSSVISINAKDVTDGTFPVPPQGGGLQHVTVRAVDKAGNKTEVTKDLTLPFVAKPKTATKADDTPAVVQSGFGIQGYILVLFALIIGGLMANGMYSRKGKAREKEKLLQAVVEVRDKNDRIFSAMREEFEQIINNFDIKPQLTAEERNLLESIKEVLDISEELVDTSIEDLKKMVRNQV